MGTVIVRVGLRVVAVRMDIELDPLDALPRFAGEVDVDTIRQRESCERVEENMFGNAEVAERADGHVPADARETVEKKRSHGARNKYPRPVKLAIAHAGLAFCAMVLSAMPMQSAEPPTAAQMEAVFGIPLWTQTPLWQEDAPAVAQRLGWPEESRTSQVSSYRLYPGREARVLGCRPFSLALYGKAGKPEQISMVFANKGDANGLVDPKLLESTRPADKVRATRAIGEFKTEIRKEAASIDKSLTALLGPPKADRFGQGRTTRENARRWDWNGHAILLVSPRDEYVALRILPVAVADGEAHEHVSDTDIRDMLASRVEHRENGDVIIRDIPMVDQGPKGYCVPATWERALRYLGIPADMYVLAMAGGTEIGGGTNVGEIVAGVGEMVRLYGRRVVRENGALKIRNIAKYIDRGLPVMWSLGVVDDLNIELIKRERLRKNTTDWKAWVESLKPSRRAAAQLDRERKQGHVCMIIGYNEKTGELAISDSWGKEFEERWITEEEAAAISQGEFTIINW